MLSLSVVAALAAAGWWWVTWPERTARQLVDLLGNGERDAARNRLNETGTEGRVDLFFQFYISTDWNQTVLKPQPRAFDDVISARQTFKMLGWRVEVKSGQLILLNAPVGYKLDR